MDDLDAWLDGPAQPMVKHARGRIKAAASAPAASKTPKAAPAPARKRGRPLGSKNKVSKKAAAPAAQAKKMSPEQLREWRRARMAEVRAARGKAKAADPRHAADELAAFLDG